MADWVLWGERNWRGNTFTIPCTNQPPSKRPFASPFRLVTVYATAVVLENGEVRFFDDIYGEDIRLEALMAKGPVRE